MKLTAAQLAAGTGGRLVHDGPPGPVSTDSRRLGPGDWFLALSGDRFDGHDFLKHAQAAGCAGAIARHVHSYDLGAAALAHAGPMLVLRCGRDNGVNRALAPWLQRLAARPNISFAELPDGGHCGNLDAGPGWRSALVKFWQNTGSG